MRKTFSKIWSFSKNRHNSLVQALVLSLLRSCTGITQIFAVIIAIRVLTGNAEVKSSAITIAVLTLICIVSNFLTSYFEQVRTSETGFFMTADKRISIGNILKKLPLGYFTDSSSGKITATLSTTLSGVETASTMVMVGIISGLFSAFAMFLFMMFYDYRIGIVTGAGILVYLLVVAWQMKVSEQNAPALQKAQTELADSSLTFFKGIKVTKAYSFNEGDRNLKDKIQGSCDSNIKLTRVSMPSQFASRLVIAVAESVILLLTIYIYFKTGDNDLVKTIVLVIFSFVAFGSLNQAGSMLSMIGLLNTGIDEVERIEKEKQLKEETPAIKPESDEIRFENVSFSYGDNLVLRNIFTVIKPKTLTAIVGPSGSGKTTMCQLIPRFRDVTEGRITIGNADIRNIESERLMEKISMVFQNVFLFEDTILNNIRFGKPDATLEQVKEAAEKAMCHDFIMNLPDGYDTIVKEGGVNLSGGEKQRISIARAILKDSPIIILDEATSALDADNENEIMAAIDELVKDKTVIMIAHRIKTVEKADHIIVLSDGEIVQEGTHSELVNEPGIYKDFIEIRHNAENWKL